MSSYKDLEMAYTGSGDSSVSATTIFLSTTVETSHCKNINNRNSQTVSYYAFNISDLKSSFTETNHCSPRPVV